MGEGGSGANQPTGGNGAGPAGGNGGDGANGGNGGDGGSGAEGGGNPGFTNLVTVRDLAGEPLEDADVIIHDADGVFVELVNTSADGTAELNVPPGGAVTVVRHGFRQTFMQVPPNAPLVFRAQRNLPIDKDIDYTVSFTNPPGNASTVRFYSTCSGNSSTQPVGDSTTLLHRGDCRDRDTFDILAIARDVNNNDVGYGFAGDQPLDDLTPPPIAITSTAFASVTASTSTLPAGTTSYGAFTLILSDQQQLYFGSSDGVEDPVGPQMISGTVPNAVFFDYVTSHSYEVTVGADNHQFFRYDNSSTVPFDSVLPDIDVDRMVLEQPTEVGTFPFHSIEETYIGDAMILFIKDIYVFVPTDIQSPIVVPKMPPGFEQYDVVVTDGELNPGIANADFDDAADYADVLGLGFSFQAGFEGLNFSASQFNTDFVID